MNYNLGLNRLPLKEGHEHFFLFLKIINTRVIFHKINLSISCILFFYMYIFLLISCLWLNSMVKDHYTKCIFSSTCIFIWISCLWFNYMVKDRYIKCNIFQLLGLCTIVRYKYKYSRHMIKIKRNEKHMDKIEHHNDESLALNFN